MSLHVPTENKLPQFVEVKRAIIYARVSTDQQAEYGTSIDNQVEKSIAYAEAKCMKIVSIFKEDFSGTTMDRPELNKVRAILQTGGADALIIYKVDRQDRSWAGVNYLMFLQELQQLGIEFHKSEQGRQINLNDATQILLETIEGWQAGTDHKRTVEKLHRGRIDTARKGHVIATGRPPFGYRWIKNEATRRTEFEIIEDEAEIVKQMFNWYVFGDESHKPLGVQTIAKKLTDLGIETFADRHQGVVKKAKRGVWHTSSVRHILTNKTYAGMWTFAKRTSRKYVGQNEPTNIPVKVPAIISPELFELAKQRQETRAKVSNRKKHNYLLAGHLKCGCCGYAMTGKPSHRGKNRVELYYSCAAKSNKFNNRRVCNNPFFRLDRVDPAVWTWLEKFIFDESELLKGLKDYQAARSHNPLENELKLIKAELNNKESEFKAAMEDMKAAISRRAKVILAQDLERIESQLDALELRRAELEAELKDKMLTDDQITDLMQFAAMLRIDWEIISQDYESLVITHKLQEKGKASSRVVNYW
ncbi:MAG: recombinase family protein [Anaerolineae bacterium]|nr:recombinase family protein [Anaerolineae bacterium]